MTYKTLFSLRKDHSAKMFLLAMVDELRAAGAARRSSVLILLDLSAAFHTVNHQIKEEAMGLATGRRFYRIQY